MCSREASQKSGSPCSRTPPPPLLSKSPPHARRSSETVEAEGARRSDVVVVCALCITSAAFWAFWCSSADLCGSSGCCSSEGSSRTVVMFTPPFFWDEELLSQPSSHGRSRSSEKTRTLVFGFKRLSLPNLSSLFRSSSVNAPPATFLILSTTSGGAWACSNSRQAGSFHI